MAILSPGRNGTEYWVMVKRGTREAVAVDDRVFWPQMSFNTPLVPLGLFSLLDFQ